VNDFVTASGSVHQVMDTEIWSVDETTVESENQNAWRKLSH